MRFGPNATCMLIAQSDMHPRNAASVLGWKVLVVQNLEATLQPMRRLQLLVLGWGVALALVFSFLVYLLARRAVRPYAGLLDPVMARFRTDSAVRTTGLTRYLDAVSTQSKEDDAPRVTRGLPQARIGEQQPLEVMDMLALTAEDASCLQQLRDLLQVGVVVFHGAQRLMYWNRQCELIFGRSTDEVVGGAPWDGFMNEFTPAEVAELIERVNVQHKAYTVLPNHPLSEGSQRQCLWTVVPERDAKCHLVRTLAQVQVQDVTGQAAAKSSEAGDAREISALAHQLLDQEAQITSRQAQTLHDRIGQTLSALRLAFDAVDARDGRQAAAANATSKTKNRLQFGMAYREGGRDATRDALRDATTDAAKDAAKDAGLREGGASRRNALLRAEYRTEDIGDPSTGASGRTVAQRGAYLRLRFKFDEALF